MTKAGRPARALVALIVVACGCEHPVSVVDVQEAREPLAGTQLPTGRPLRLTLEVVEGPSPDGRLHVRASEHRWVSERVRISRSATQLYNPFIGAEPIVKTIVVPIGIALFGVILWKPSLHSNDEPTHDHDGDGRYGALEYFSDLSSWFNPLSAVPNQSKRTQRRPMLLEPREEADTRELSQPLAGARVRAELLPSGSTVDAATGSDGSAELDLALALRSQLGGGAELRLSLPDREPALTQALAVSLEVVASIVEERFPGELARAPAELRGRLRERQRASADEAWATGDRERALGIAAALAAAHPQEPELLDWCLARYDEHIRSLWAAGQNEESLRIARELNVSLGRNPAVRDATIALYEERIHALWAAEDYAGAVDTAIQLARLLPASSEQDRALRDLARTDGARVVALTVRDLCTQQVQEGELGGRLAALGAEEREQKFALLRDLLEAGADSNRFRIVGHERSVPISLGGSASLFTTPQRGEIVEGSREGVSALSLAEAAKQADLAALLERFGALR